jgi:hypothetical protein
MMKKKKKEKRQRRETTHGKSMMRMRQKATLERENEKFELSLLISVKSVRVVWGVEVRLTTRTLSVNEYKEKFSFLSYFLPSYS